VEELAEHRPWRVFTELPSVDEFMRVIEHGRAESAEAGPCGAGDRRQ
jgi:hypothetical protein